MSGLIVVPGVVDETGSAGLAAVVGVVPGTGSAAVRDGAGVPVEWSAWKKSRHIIGPALCFCFLLRASDLWSLHRCCWTGGSSEQRWWAETQLGFLAVVRRVDYL